MSYIMDLGRSRLLMRTYSSPCNALVLALGGLAVFSCAGRAQTAEDFFRDDVLHELRLEIHPSDWQKLKANFGDNTYYPCSLQWRGLLVEDIAIRSRGTGSRNGQKPGLRVDFNRYEDKQRFLGLKSFVLDNLVQDPSLIRERVSMALFRRLGIATPRESQARLYVNDAYMGLYLTIESVDKDFLKRTLGEDEGYLYDYQRKTEYRFEDLGPDPAAYSPVLFKPATHETKPEPEPLVAMIRTMNQAPINEFESAMGEFLDLKRFLRHVAVEAFLGEIDGIVGFWGMNNFYLYRYAKSNRFEFIPWDKDVDFISIEHPILYNVETNVLTRKALAIPALRKAYMESLIEIAESAGGAGGWMEQEMLRAYLQVRGAALADTTKPTTNENFEDHATYLLQFARERSDWVRLQVAAEPVQ